MYLISRGIDLEKITPRFFSKSIGCCKKFPGRNSITEITTLNHWINQLSLEISERLEKDEIENNRRPKQITVSYLQTIRGDDVSSSRTVNLNVFNQENLRKESLDILKKNTETFFKTDSTENLNNPVKFLGISAGKFESISVPNSAPKINKIMELFGNHAKKNLNETENSIIPVEKIVEKTNSIKDLFNNQSKKVDEVVEDKPSEARSFFKQILKNQPSLDKVSTKIEVKEDTSETPETKSFFKTVLQETVSEVIETSETIPENYEIEEIIPVQIEIGESSKPIENYTKTYAEYFIPKQTSNVFITCELCEQEINEAEVASHKDFHFALHISQQQRTEFRNEIKNKKTTSSSPANKKRKIGTSIKSKSIDSKLRPIGNFLFKPKPKPSVNTPTEKCLECERFIPIDDIIEHADYHAAKKLQIELNKNSMAQSQSVQDKCKTVSKNSVASFFDKKIF